MRILQPVGPSSDVMCTRIALFELLATIFRCNEKHMRMQIEKAYTELMQIYVILFILTMSSPTLYQFSFVLFYFFFCVINHDSRDSY